MSQVAGRVTIMLGSEQLQSKPGASLQTGGIERTYDLTDQLEPWYSEKGIASQIEATIICVAETDLAALRKWKNGTAKFLTDNGHVFTIPKAGTASLGPLQNGEVQIRIGGGPAE
jgi:hypothetical protein